MITAFGVVVALAGIEHGVGELLQGATRPDGLFIESWPDTAAFEILSGEPAMTVVPSLLAARRATASTRGRPGPAHRSLARLWRSFTVIGIAGYLALMPGTVLLSMADIESETLVIVCSGLAFGGLLLAMPSALAADRSAA